MTESGVRTWPRGKQLQNQRGVRTCQPQEEGQVGRFQMEERQHFQQLEHQELGSPKHCGNSWQYGPPEDSEDILPFKGQVGAS